MNGGAIKPFVSESLQKCNVSNRGIAHIHILHFMLQNPLIVNSLRRHLCDYVNRQLLKEFEHVL